MSKKQPVKIKLKDEINVNPGDVFLSKIVKSGNGAVAKAYKRHIGKDCIIIVEEPYVDNQMDKLDNKKKKKFANWIMD
jgi:putative transposon-encoded protein